MHLGRFNNIPWCVAMWDGTFDDGVSLFTEPINGIKGNYYEPFVVGFADDIEALAETYYLHFGDESKRIFLCPYFAKLTYEQRKQFTRERSEYGYGNY